ncbi:hypothetical protein JGH11_06910 [Dysgonomonas sp. Marseille-P4677]|uniref:DUF6242 domain-containing protein n=1 Tax=Dysgonomonas sp. Marseille-P4677 TaxID=2364790 RepID=UPI0019141273|nr:DUF6242 domain-containing protein [Dysgonomonas sp. Marseille-P4677]MBK5720598.1 hypothetical protein [Dysgonomonas sp. Marseille-P4677]
MKLKQITKLLFAIFIAYGLSSCNSDSTDYTTTSASSDAQIYSFKLSAKPYTKEDTVNYPVMAKTRFSIDQFKASIYNTDSLPYKTSLRNVYVSLGFGSSSPSKLQVIYSQPDSIADWNGTDSVDFSRIPKIRVIPANGSTADAIEYSIDLRIHKVDPDTLVWEEIKALEQPATIKRQKTLLVDNKTFYTFSIDSDNKLYLHTADKSTAYNSRVSINGLDAAKIKLESITYFNNHFYAVDSDKKAYVADKNGLNWSQKNENIINIVGVLPTTNPVNDVLLVVAEKSDGTYFARTSDMDNLIYEESPVAGNVNGDFPISDFTSVTNYDRNNINNCILAATGGSDGNNLTWSVQLDDNKALRIASNQKKDVPFKLKNGIVTFLYDGYLFALVENQFYKSASYGSKWIVAPNKEILDSKIPKASKQSIIVDEDNYIWIFGGIKDVGGASVQFVWRGRLNKLNPKN